MSELPRQVPGRDQVIVTGSLAFDHIMDFPGYFKDHILPEKVHIINISFLVGDLKKQRGGCAGNIAYSLALLGESPRVVATGGHDFGDYRRWLSDRGVDTSAIEVVEDEITASCFITADRAGCQITGFHVGAMARARELSLATLAGKRAAVAIVAPDDPEAMMRHCREARESGLPFFFDPSFQVTAMDGEALAEASRGSLGIFLNDYEYSVFQEKTGRKGGELFELTQKLIVTLGGEGSQVLLADGSEVRVPAAPIDAVIDPTGAGDAFRGGFLAGWVRGHELGICGRMGSVASAYAIECYGTQNHSYDQVAFWERYRQSFGPPPGA